MYKLINIMKKIILTAIVIASMFAVSCNSNKTVNTTPSISDTLTVVNDTTCTTHTVTNVNAKK